MIAAHRVTAKKILSQNKYNNEWPAWWQPELAKVHTFFTWAEVQILVYKKRLVEVEVWHNFFTQVQVIKYRKWTQSVKVKSVPRYFINLQTRNVFLLFFYCAILKDSVIHLVILSYSLFWFDIWKIGLLNPLLLLTQMKTKPLCCDTDAPLTQYFTFWKQILKVLCKICLCKMVVHRN